MRKIILIFILFLFFSARNVIASTIPGVQTPISIVSSNNLISNGDFETGNAEGWKFGNINRVVAQGAAQNGSYWLDTSNCSSCPSDFGNDKTIVYDVSGNFTIGQKYSASVYFSSPQGGSVRLALWELGNTSELLGVADKIGSGDWQKMEINDVAIRNGGNETLRVQIYYNTIADNINYSFDNFVLSQAGSNCPTSYYTYQQPLNVDSPTLDALFSGKAHFQPINEALATNLQFNPSHVTSYWDNKLPIIFNSDDGKYYAFTRGIDKSINHWNMYVMVSTDGLNFIEVGPMFDQSVITQLGDMYDGHIAIDYSVCPIKYYMAMECSGQMCASYSTDPFNPSSWSRPKTIVHFVLDSKNGVNANKESASTGVFLIDGNNKYVSWTVLAGGPIDTSWGIDPSDGVFKKLRDMGTESTYSRAIATTDFLTDLGYSNIGNVVLPAETNTHCTSSWDCNNRDKQDWKKEGNYYYLIYNGANYYGCWRLSGDGTNVWGLGIVRSTNPLSGYDLFGVGEIITGMENGCTTSYPIINQINGELYMYYAYIKNGANQTLRSKLVWNTSPTPTPTPTPLPLPGDLNHDNKVNIRDYSQLVTDFGKTGSPGFVVADINNDGTVDVFDYNILVGNFGK